MKSKATTSKVAGEGRLQLTRALRQLRDQVGELGEYSPARPSIELRDGSDLKLTLEKSADGSELLGCWQIIRRWPDGRQVIYPV